jgi:uroporphyrinogen-III synthase
VLNKALALKNGIHIDDFEFIDFTYLNTPELRQSIENSEMPLVFTSRHALIAFNKMFSGSANRFSCFCIEGETSSAALDLGFNILSTARDSVSLASKIINHQIQSVHFLCGDLHRKELSEILLSAGVAVTKSIVYLKEIRPIQISETVDGILFFSPSQADAYLINNSIVPEIPLFCIGHTSAEHLRNLGYSNTFVPEKHSESSLVELLCTYFIKKYA